jgi:peroxiredoxin
MLSPGDDAPPFDLPGATAAGRERYRLADSLGSGAVVVSFFPFAFSPICTDQLCALRDIEWVAIEDDVDVLGISGDSTYAQQAFIEAYDIDFPLLTDRTGAVSEAYDVLCPELDGHPDVPDRAVFVIDADGVVRHALGSERHLDHPDGRRVADAVRDVLDAR